MHVETAATAFGDGFGEALIRGRQLVGRRVDKRFAVFGALSKETIGLDSTTSDCRVRDQDDAQIERGRLSKLTYSLSGGRFS
jgi:hypothetical protein